jgi:signal transduction histidine kinase
MTWFLAEFSYKKKKAEISLKIAHDELEKKVVQRVKELNCMYEMVKLSAAHELSISEILKKVINIIPAGLPLSNGGKCRINLDGVVVESDSFKSDSSVIQAPLIIDENERGGVEVSFSGNKPNVDEELFKIEEKALIDSLSKQLSIIVSQKERDQEKAKLEAQLFQSQKMEAIGQLSGGIAHDFNNMLTIINGFAELGKLSVEADSDLNSNFEEIIKAGNKAASLTRQLLAFSRKDSIQPKPFQINEIIENSMKLISRLVGEDIIKKIELDQDIPLIKADQTQIDQMLFNLVINARDAINAREGNHKKIITIATKVLYIKKEEVEQVLDIEDGTYVVIEVTDTGTGMSIEIQKKIFIFIFSTKEKKKGTGLGLSTVYGIVKQNRGNINVYSEVGIGTTFRIYWPVLKEKERGVSIEQPELKSVTFKRATILVVEDDNRLNHFACNALKSDKLTVLKAFEGEEAIKLLQRNSNKIDLIFTDVVLPGMNGRELAAKAEIISPGIKVLYTSGYTENFFSEDGILPSDIHFLRKPYSIQALYEKTAFVLSL